MIKHILVTGANGQLAKTIKERFSKNNENISFQFVSREEIDISNEAKVEDLISKNNFSYCINCAAYTNVELAEDESEKAHKINAEAVKILAKNCKRNNVVLIHISTDYVFNGKKNQPYKETDKTSPINVYGKTKLLGEQYIQETLQNYFIIRTSWLYSAFGKNFVKTILQKANENLDLTILTSQKGTPTSCIDLASFIFHLIKNDETCFGIFHLSAKGETTWFDFAKHVASHVKNYNLEKIKPVEFFKTKAIRPEYSVLSNDKALTIFTELNNWKKSVSTVIEKLQ